MSKLSKGILALLVITCMLITAVPMYAADDAATDDAEVGFNYFTVDFDTLPFPESGNCYEGLAVADGIMTGTSTGGDPYMNYNDALAIPADKISEIRIRMKYDSDNSSFQFFFTTDTIGWSEDASFKADLSTYTADKDGYIVIVIDTSTCAQWMGTVTSIRLDPLSAEGTFAFDYINFWCPDLTVLKVDWASYSEVPFSAQNIARLEIEDGYLSGLTHIRGTSRKDPYMNFTGEFSLDASIIKAIHFKMKSGAGAGTFQFFFTTETIGWSEDASFRVDLSKCEKDDYGWYLIEIDTTTCAEWKGTITSFRLDPVEANGAFVFGALYFDGAVYSDLSAEDAEAAINEVFFGGINTINAGAHRFINVAKHFGDSIYYYNVNRT